MASSSTDRPERDQDQVDADVAATRDRLVSAVEALVFRVHPQRIKQREVAGAKRFAHTELENLKLLVFNAAGDLRTDRVARAGGGAAGFLGLLLVLRGLVRSSRRGSRVVTDGSPKASRRAARSARRSTAVAAPAPPDSSPPDSSPSVSARAARKARSAEPAAVVDDVEARVRRARKKA